jgi:hypothetical protein
VPYRKIGDWEIERIEVHDIKGRKTPNPDKEYDCSHIRGGRMDWSIAKRG